MMDINTKFQEWTADKFTIQKEEPRQMKEITTKYDQQWVANKIAIQKEEPSLEELVRQLMVNTMKSQQSIDASLLKLEEKACQLARQFEDISKQSLNSHHDPNLDIENLSNFDTSYTCDPDICVEINSSMLLVSISFARFKSYPDTPKVHMTVEDTGF